MLDDLPEPTLYDCQNCGANIYDDFIFGFTHVATGSYYCYPEAARYFSTATNQVAKKDG